MYIPMTIGGKRFNETSLWTNANPTSTFASQAMTLSDDIDNYDYLRIHFRNSTSNSTECDFLITPSDLKKSAADNGNNRVYAALSCVSTNAYVRRLIYTSNTSISTSACLQINASATNNNACIPLEIKGCKFA